MHKGPGSVRKDYDKITSQVKNAKCSLDVAFDFKFYNNVVSNNKVFREVARLLALVSAES